ncbi:MAG: hypothetical protein ACRYG8_42920 [Janthinobacterium lividum]
MTVLKVKELKDWIRASGATLGHVVDHARASERRYMNSANADECVPETVMEQIADTIKSLGYEPAFYKDEPNPDGIDNSSPANPDNPAPINADTRAGEARPKFP